MVTDTPSPASTTVLRTQWKPSNGKNGLFQFFMGLWADWVGLAVLTGGPCSHLKPWLDGVLQKALSCIPVSLVETIGKPGGSLHVFSLCGQSGLLPNVEVLAEWISHRLVAYP